MRVISLRIVFSGAVLLVILTLYLLTLSPSSSPSFDPSLVQVPPCSRSLAALTTANEHVRQLNNGRAVNVLVTDLYWYAQERHWPKLNEDDTVRNCQIPCYWRRASTAETVDLTGKSFPDVDGLLSLIFGNFGAADSSVKAKRFQRWALYAMEPQYYYSFYGDKTWLERQHADIFLNFHEDMADVPVSYIETSESEMVNAIPFDLKTLNSQQPVLISWFVARATEFRLQFGLKLVEVMGDEMHLFGKFNQARNLSEYHADCTVHNHWHKEKKCVIQRYPFYLAVENTWETDYASEKLWDPLSLGVVPVVKGAPNTPTFLPQRSVVYIDDYPTPEGLAEHLRWIVNTPGEYEKYHEWRKMNRESWPEGFRKKLHYSMANMECNLCFELARQRLLSEFR